MGKDPGVGFPFGMITMGSPNVLIGGFPMPGWMTILKGLGKMLKPLIRRIQLKMPEGRLRQAMCALTGHPVDIASGRMFTTKTDFTIDGRVPIKFERIYDTSAIDYEGSLGWGWIHPFEQHLWESKKRNCLVLRNNENRQVRFDKLAVGERQFQPLERTWLERTAEFEFKLFDCKDGLTYRFGRTDQFSEDFSDEKNALRLLDISDRNGNRVELEYRENLLRKIRNGTETHVELFHQTVAGKTRLVEIQQHLKNGQTISLMRFGYNEEAELHTATDRTYQPFIYEYENHLLTRETNRNKLSFYFEYEGAGTSARCVHTRGDGNIYERWLEYLPKSRITKVRDGLGGETIYHYNELDLITKTFNAEGGIYQFEYGEFGELLKDTDELGRARTYTYDEQLNCIGVVREDSGTRRIEFNEFCQPLAIINEEDSQWRREYDANGNIIATINPLEARREFEYDSFGDIIVFRDALGNETKLDWTNSGKINSVTRPLGGKTFYLYNERDFLSEITDDFTGLKRTYQYDDAGRIVRIAETNNRRETVSVRRYEYDDQGNLILETDALGNRTSYSYSGFDKLSERIDALGYKRQFKYDREERLKELINERGESYSFEYDLLDRVTEETRFDLSKRFYKYNQAHELVYQKDSLDRETFYQRDAVGRVIKRLRSDASTVIYNYNKSGRVIKAENANSTVILDYDAAMQIVSENQNGQIIKYEYDAEGKKTARVLITDKVSSSRIEYEYDAGGNLSLIKIGDRTINYERDRAGRVTSRQMPNGLREQFDYDINGRLNLQKVTVGVGGREIVKRGYEWDALGNVAGINDSLRGSRRYGYDAVERLSKVERIIADDVVDLPEPDEMKTPKSDLPADKLLWQADERGGANFRQRREIEEFQYDGDSNLIERKSDVKGSRSFKYGKGDRLEEQNKIQYIYDAVGNLIQKRQTNGVFTSFQYDADNQLVSVSGGTGGNTSFEYDAFGRRTAKISVTGEKTDFLWDGNVLLVENTDSRNFTEYIHDGFIPLAKIENSRVETYHTDYLGTPKEVTGQNGEILWQGNYDEYGKVNAVKSETEQNIRFQGQYEDTETGLFYNRFRYYDAESCRYINQDPISLEGGYNIYAYSSNPIGWLDVFGLSGFDPFEHGEITPFPDDIKFGQQRIAPNFSTIGSQAHPDVVGRPVADVGADIAGGRLDPNVFVISYTRHPDTGDIITLNNRGLAAVSIGGKRPDHAIFIPFDRVPPHLVADVGLTNPLGDVVPARSIAITEDKAGTKIVGRADC